MDLILSPTRLKKRQKKEPPPPGGNNHSNRQHRPEKRQDSWEMSAYDALQVNYLTQESNNN